MGGFRGPWTNRRRRSRTSTETTRSDVKRIIDRSVVEDDLLLTITEAATLLGWRWMHLGADQRGVYRGHTGWPDLVLAKEGRETLYFELKREEEDPRDDQIAWLHALGGVVIRPSDLDYALGLLR